MNKLQLCLGMSITLSIGQLNFLPAQAQSSGAIWQKLSAGNVTKQGARVSAVKSKAAKPAAHTQNYVVFAPSSASAANGHAMLFLAGKGKHVTAGDVVPSAALSIHPALS